MSSITSFMNQISTYIKINYCQPANLELSKIDQHFQKEQNYSMMLLLLGMFPILFLLCCFGYGTISHYMQMVAFLLLQILLMKKKKYEINKIIVVVSSFLIPLFWTLDKDFQYKIPEIQIILNHSTIFTLLITRSVLYTSILFILFASFKKIKIEQ